MSSLEMAMPVRHIHIHPDTYSAPAGSAAQAAILPATVPFKAGQPTAALAHQVLSKTPQPEPGPLGAP